MNWERTALKPVHGAWVVVALFVLLSNLYGLVTPVLEASDEPYHYPYVQYVATQHRLPVQDPENIQRWKQEGGQPPLYYAIMAAATFWINTDDLPQRLDENPHAKIGIPMAEDNKNLMIHSAAERFPYRGTVLAVHLIRVLSTLMGAGTVLLTYAIAREVGRGPEMLPVAAAAVTAFNPMFLFISASVNNDNLAILLCSLAVWQAVRLLRSGATPGCAAALGATVGLAALTKMSALGLAFVAAAVISWDAWKRRSWRAWLRHGLLAAGTAAAVCGWWYLRNWMLYGDPLAFNVWLAIAGARPVSPDLKGLIAEFEGFRISYWGLFGGVNVLMHPLVYRFYDALALLAVLGLGVGAGRWAARRLRERGAVAPGQRTQISQMAVLGLWVAILAAALVRWTRLTLASQGRLIFPGIAAVSFLLVLGWTELMPRRGRTAVMGCLLAVLLAVAALAPWAFIAPSYATPPLLASLPESLRPLNITYGEKLELVGYGLPDREALPGQTLAVELGWRTLAPMDTDYSIFVHLYGRDGQFVGQADTYPGGGLLPTSQLAPGSQFLDRVVVPVKAGASAPAVGRIVVGVYHVPDMAMEPARDPNGADLGTSPTIGRFKVAAPEPGLQGVDPSLSAKTEYRFGESLALAGYDLSAAPGEVTLYWRADGPVAADYTVFVHLLDDTDRPAAQADGQPQGGQYPTSWWSAGEVVEDRHLLPAESLASLPPGSYTLAVGLYDLSTGERLAVSAEGVGQGDRVVLGQVRIP